MIKFEELEKEPKLSDEMKSIIETSHNMDDGDKYDDIERYKYKIMKMLTSNADILTTLHNEELAQKIKDWDNPNGDIYRNVNIFGFMKLPDLKDSIMNYICFEVVDYGGYNDMVTKQIVFRTVSHVDDIKTDWGIDRQDLLGAIIKNEFDWSNVFGMTIKRDQDVGHIGEDGFYYREIIYTASTPNNHYNKTHPRY